MDFVKGPGNHPEARISRMVKTYEKDLLRLCCMYLKDTVMAEDAVQETFIKAYKNLHAFRGESSEKTWLMRIAINVCKDMLRTAWFRNLGKMVSIENVQIPAEQEMSVSSELVSEIMKLPSKYKEVVLLYYYHGMNMAETAEILRISRAAVQKRLKKDYELLRIQLEGSENE